MGYYGNIKLKQKARKLRASGKSYSEIIGKLHLSKATVSDWCKDVILTDEQLQVLYQNKTSGALKGSYVAAQRKKDARKQITENLYKLGILDVGSLSKRDRFIAGIAYYSAEGTKTDKGCAIANSDPSLIKFMANWFLEFGGITREKFHGALWIHAGNNETDAKLFWSSLINMPIHNFYKSYFVPSKESGNKIRKQKYPYGVFSLYVSDVALQRKIMGWIGGILQKPMV